VSKSYVDSARFSNAMNQLAATVNRPLRDVIRSEIGSILKQTAGDVEVTTQAKADTSAWRRTLRARGLTSQSTATNGYATENVGMRGERGRVWYRTKNNRFQLAGEARGGIVKWANLHFKSDDWEAMNTAVSGATAVIPAAVKAARRAIGLSRQSVIQMADSIGIRLETVPGGGISISGISKARAAIASDGNAHINGTGSEKTERNTYIATLINSLPYCRKIKIDQILARRINGRTAYFQQNLSRGVFDHANKVLRAYPGFKVT